MTEVKVLVEGMHGVPKDGRLKIGSTCTLIKGEENILVDTGTFLAREKIIEALKQEGLTPENIDKVVLTHLHLDHLVNVDLFNKAKIYLKFKGGNDYPGQYQVLSEGYLNRADLSDGAEISKGVKIIHTSGHTMDLISVVVETDKGKVVITGDAISDESWTDLNKQPEPMIVVGVEKYNESRKKILEIADYIIPGHGGMFKVKK